jgi:hypothetical protein
MVGGRNAEEVCMDTMDMLSKTLDHLLSIRRGGGAAWYTDLCCTSGAGSMELGTVVGHASYDEVEVLTQDYGLGKSSQMLQRYGYLSPWVCCSLLVACKDVWEEKEGQAPGESYL